TVVPTDKNDVLECSRCVTIDNQNGKTVENAKIKLMTDDVSKIQEAERFALARSEELAVGGRMAAPVTEKAFEDYHLYNLARPTSLRDRETKTGGIHSR